MILSHRIAMLVAGVGAIVGVALTLWMGIFLTERIDDESRAKSELISRTLSDVAIRLVAERDAITAVDLLNRTLNQNSEIEYIIITDLSGEPFAHTFKGGFPVALSPLLSEAESVDRKLTRSLEVESRQLIHTAVPLITGSPGRIHLALDETAARQRVTAAQWRIAGLSSAVVLIGCVLGVVMARRIAKPLQQTAESLAAYGRHEQSPHDESALANAGPEIAQLWRAFRDMRRSRETAEAESRRERIFFESLFNSANAMIMVVNKHGRIERVNAAFAAASGHDVKALVGKDPWPLLLPPEHSGDGADAMSSLSASGRIDAMELPLLTASGAIRQVRWSASMVAGAEEQSSFSTFVGVDITDQQVLADRLRQSQKMEAVGQLTGGVAHEFNNLLQVVVGNLSLLDGEFPQGDVRRKRTDMAMRGAQRGADLTQRLLVFSRKGSLAPRHVAIDKMLDDFLGLLSGSIEETVAIDVVQAPDTTHVFADPALLETALLNMCLNARDAMPGGGKLSISVKTADIGVERIPENIGAAPGRYVEFAVADTGIGMSRHVREHAFEPFYTTKDVGVGTGLGLSMVYGFARQSGGLAEINSAEGEGSIVRILLPVVSGGGADEHAKPAAPQPNIRKRLEVLLVEDDGDVRESLVALLGVLNCSVTEAESGAQALNKLRSGQDFDLLLTDIVMPGGMSGIELAETAGREFTGLNTIFTTGYPVETIARVGRLPKDALVIKKPYTLDELAEHLAVINQLSPKATN
ncbi:MAG: response regulator [Rhodospirillaceae bacterium]|jgi:PAS domain S-box-containing protein|nr:response regulator [Rhodospirillaceae bacterium]